MSEVREVRDVALPTYSVTIGSGVLSQVGDIVRRVAPAHRYAIISDHNVAPLYADRVQQALGPSSVVFTVPAGEEYKTRETWSGITDGLLSIGFGRDAAIIALGGGVIGDLAGFVAATYMRGIPFVQVPTTLLAMVDASVGGKTGVDTPAGKNLVGAFHQPAAVIADADVLETLPADHLRAGAAEAIKHGIIADAGYLERVVAWAEGIGSGAPNGAQSGTLLELVARSVEIKSDVVRRDEREGGVRKTLNFGHTIGHAIELLSNFALLHGFAVGIGMVYESRLAERLGVAEAGTAARVHDAVSATGLPTSRPEGMSVDEIVRVTHGDKKARAGQAEYSLPTKIGAMAAADGAWSLPVSDELVREILA